MKIILEFIFDNNFDIVFIMYRFDLMKQKVISEAEQKRIDRFKLIKDDFKLMTGSKTAIVKLLAKKHEASTATIYKALKMKGESK